MKELLSRAMSKAGTGLLGTIAITTAFEAANKLLGTKIDLPPALGSVVTGDARAKATRPIGGAMHFAVGTVVLPLAYDAAFRLLGKRNMKTGALVGAVHGVISGLALAGADRVHPAISRKKPSFLGTLGGTLPPIGAFASNAGREAPAAFFLGHVLYGALQGRAKPRRLVARLAEGALASRGLASRATAAADEGANEERNQARFQKSPRRGGKL